MTLRIFVLCCVALFSSHVSAQCSSQRYLETVFDEVDVTYNIHFATATPYGAFAQPQDLSLNLYEPHGDTLSKRPLIVYAFGGAYLIGDKQQPPIPEMANYFARIGYCFAAIDYRIGFNVLSTGSAERAVYRAIQDERAALRFLAHHCAQYRIDTNNIFLAGSSAGCFTALHQTFMTEDDRPASTYGIPLEPDDLGCVDCIGNNFYGNRKVPVRGIMNLWGAILDTSYITTQPDDNVPVISFHGTSDPAVPYTQGYPFYYPVFPVVYGSYLIHQRLNNLGIMNELHPLVGYGHEPELLEPSLNDTIWNYSKRFLYRIMKPAPPAISGETIVCSNRDYTYQAPPNNGSRYCWDVSGNYTLLNQNWNSITLQWNDTGQASIALRELNYLHIGTDSTVLNISVQTPPQAGFSATVNQLTVQITNQSIGANAWQYTTGNTTLLLENPQLSFSEPGSYPITQVVSNGICQDTFTQTVTLDTCPVAVISYSQTGHLYLFEAAGSNAVSFQWSFGNGDTSSMQSLWYSFPDNGVHVVTLTVTNALGCKASATAIITVTEIPEQQMSHPPFTILPGKICISNPSAQTTIRNMQGQIVYAGNDPFIHTTTWSRGIYFISITSGNNSRQFKISLQQ